MLDIVKPIIKIIPFYPFLRDSFYKYKKKKRLNKQVKEWRRKGSPPPAPVILKYNTVKWYAKRYALKILIETGTYKGEMIDEVKNSFDKIYSIELCQELFEKAKEKFKTYDHIELIQGDSADRLEMIIKKINQPVLFWLDAHSCPGNKITHYEKETSIRKELVHILNAQDLGHVLLIDDSNCFGRNAAYPTIEELKKLILSKRPNALITVKDYIIRVVSK